MPNNQERRYDEDLELLSELLEGCMQEEGYKVQRYEETSVSTSAYRGLFVTDSNGRVFTIKLNEKWKERDGKGESHD